MNEELLKEVFSDEAYVKTLLELDTAEEVQASLKEKGVELSVEDITEAKNVLIQKANGELSDEDLDGVAGGSLTLAAGFAIAIIISAATGGTVAVGNSVHSWTGGRW